MERYEVIELLGEDFLNELESNLWKFCTLIVKANASKDFIDEFNLAFLLKDKISEMKELGE